MFGANVLEEVREYMAPLGYEVTPLHRMDALAQSLGIESLWIKDESCRSNLSSFKALGGAYAVIRLVLSEASRALRMQVPVCDLHSAEVRAVARELTVTCATGGNHGRSIAFGARLTGCGAVVFVHDGVSEARVAAIRELGAEARRVNGSYDDSIAKANQAAKDYGWHVVSDTSWPGYEEMPARVMQGYLLMVEEALQQYRGNGGIFTHIFLQAGVGGFAAAIAAHLTLRLGPEAPRFVVVEPSRAGCLFQSAIAERAVRIAPGEPTIMAMLECYEPSMIAWRILERLAHAFTMIDEISALDAMRRLASPLPGDPFILSGESGGAGLAGLIETSCDEQSRKLLGLDQESVVLLFNTEGATDPTLYASLLADAEPIHRGKTECATQCP
jgi:diaminopropionate ammonia-lyase